MLKRYVVLSIMVSAATALSGTSVSAQVPEPFQGHDPDSVFVINYADVDSILRSMVVDVGRSSRKVSAAPIAKTGTRMKSKTSSGRSTSTEGNRFYFEVFRDDEEYQQALHLVRMMLEELPERMPLEHFSRNEQLAYWINLYNIALLDELVQIYPEKNLKKELTGKKSILDAKVLTVSGASLSLNDVQHNILGPNYDNNPLIMYGLYQGIIGGPNIRKRSYTGKTVYKNLQDNAEEFVNSNRGTYSRDGDFEVSSLYKRNQQYFTDFDTDLKQHLMRFIEGAERTALQGTSEVRPDIDDWTITDVYGTQREIGGSFSTSQAAMIDAIVATAPDGQGGTVTTNSSAAYSLIMAKSVRLQEFDPELMAHLKDIRAKEEATRLLKEGRVTVEELGTVPTTTGSGSAEEEND